MFDEAWADILEFPGYLISNYGNVYNRRTNQEMSVTRTNHGHLKVGLVNEFGRRTLSVSHLVAASFVDRPDDISDQVILLDGDFNNVRSNNLAWRPRQFAWRYTRQLKENQPIHICNLPVINNETGVIYDSITMCGVSEGLLFVDIWRSTYTGDPVYPSRNTYRIVK